MVTGPMQSLHPGPNPEYPPPPRVHWLVLAIVSTVINFLIDHYTPEPLHQVLKSLAGDAWAFYLCLWIRKLNPDAASHFWCDVFVVVELAYAAINIRPLTSPQYQTLSAILETASFVLGIATIYIIRADLLKHYNEREPIGLQLGPVKTFFFSFLYFQYHLYGIAEMKKREAEGLNSDPSRYLTP